MRHGLDDLRWHYPGDGAPAFLTLTPAIQAPKGLRAIAPEPSPLTHEEAQGLFRMEGGRARIGGGDVQPPALAAGWTLTNQGAPLHELRARRGSRTVATAGLGGPVETLG